MHKNKLWHVELNQDSSAKSAPLVVTGDRRRRRLYPPSPATTSCSPPPRQAPSPSPSRRSALSPTSTTKLMMGSRQCQVCNAANFKYKCPSCLVPYCSLPCYRKHKEVPCGNASSLSSTISSEDAESTKVPQLMAQQRFFEVGDEIWILQKDQLASLVATDEIRESLKNEDIQKLIYKIDQSTNAESELDSAIQGETFRLFTDKILSVLNAQ